jgi:hypothetical protein
VRKPDGTPAEKRFVGGFCEEVPGVIGAVSDARGAFVLGPLAPGKLYLTGTGAPDFIDGSSGPVDAGSVGVELKLEPGVRVSGQVVGADGRPAAGAQVAGLWGFDESPTGSPFGGLVCDEAGRFDGVIDPREDGYSLVAYTGDRKFAGLVEIAKDAPTTDLSIRLAPSIRVHGHLSSTRLGQTVSWSNTYWSSNPAHRRLAQCSSRSATFDVLLPPGSYEWDAYGLDVEHRRSEITLTADSPDVDLGGIDLPATFLAAHKGQSLPPWTVTAARGLPLEKCAIDAFHGRWLLVEFWGYW